MNNQVSEKCCGNCKYNKYFEEHNQGNFVSGFYCNNQHSELFGCDTFYDDCCEEWEEK